ncbi:MAG: DUF4271 domain-containing protein [Crocinitomicaceae bacterium]
MILPLLLLQSNFELLDRQTHLTSILLFVILACSAIVGAGRINNPNFFTAISTGFFKFKAHDKSFNENLRISQGASIALVINFIVSISLCFFLMLFEENNYSFATISGLLLVGFLTLLQQIGFRITSIFSGQSGISESGSLITRQIWYFSGILYLLLSLLWLLNMKFKTVFVLVFLTILAISSLIRILKGLLFAFWGGFSWYYIFLYLCTFEILPVFILNKLIQMYLQTKM